MAMAKKQIALPDGRYLIYYSFDNKDSRSQADKPAQKCCDGKCNGGGK